VESNKNCIGKRLREARRAFGISQKKLGVLAGIDEYSASARMSQYEMGTHVPNFLTLQNIGKALGCPVSFFTSDDDLIAEIVYLLGKLSKADKRKILNTARKLVLHSCETVKNEPIEKELLLTE
jgi:transcriptional regulator with XRE-family HTH domain